MTLKDLYSILDNLEMLENGFLDFDARHNLIKDCIIKIKLLIKEFKNNP